MGIFDSLGKKIKTQEEGIRVSDLLELPRTMRTLMNRVIRDKEITVEAAAEHVDETPEKAKELLDTLVEKGYLLREEQESGPIYRVYYGRTHPSEIPGSLWAALEEKLED